MSDLPEPTPGRDSSAERSGLRRRTSFAFGIVLGFVMGIAAAIVLPGVFPEGGLDCVRPTSVLWEQTADGGVSLDVDFVGDGTNACDANVVFSNPPNQ